MTTVFDVPADLLIKKVAERGWAYEPCNGENL